ncbi:MAG: hypothetical protein KGO52_01385 [Nitrospirota bacterium]|nr:hypothetical protein [Nitrospirota bacterium]MDE3119019.1 hypothetical protein [Nitrospirota bacterium]MDE3226036.1 hypothetical protein [Nitrospirota bacterium]MDE3241355.1 hypothetical protein [Nitrospirota bacterium]
MGDAAVGVPCVTVTVIRFGMNVDERDDNHPQHRPQEDCFSQDERSVQHQRREGNIALNQK